MDLRACKRMAEPQQKQNQHARQVLQGTKAMGLHVPNLRNVHSHTEDALSYATLP